MATVMSMQWDGVTVEHYERLRELVRWEENVPEGLQLHIASFDESGIQVTDVWDSGDKFEAFLTERLLPATQEVGLQGQPRSDMREAHAVIAPAFRGATA